MSTSDQQGRGPLTRKQLREIRLTGATPVITAEQAAAEAPPAPPAPPLPRAAEPVDVPPAPARDAEGDPGAVPLTRRQAREQERIKTASVPVVGAEEAAPSDTEAEPAPQPELVSSVPEFAPASEQADDGSDDDGDEQVDIVPVSASAAADTVGEVPLTGGDRESDADEQDQPESAAAALGLDDAGDGAAESDGDVLGDGPSDDDVDVDIEPGERPTVNPTFGSGVLSESAAPSSTASSFDDILGAGDSAGSHVASNTLIFNPPPGEGSLSGPVASTGEILVTGSYELPQGLGSQGHAHGTADGKEVDAVLIDGELPPASSPTPIAASSAVSTIKPAGEVIRPPAPEKGNRLMLILAIVAGGLALALGVVLVVAFTTNVL
jgi:hypothetical protein